MKSWLVLILSLCFVSGCITQKKSTSLAQLEKADAEADQMADVQDESLDLSKVKEIVCSEIKRVGTHLTSKRCISKKQNEEEKRRAQENLRDFHSGLLQGSSE